MKKSDFARLCQVSPAMVSKYARAGYIATGADGVDALRSLQRLAGHLDETKRTAAILALGDGRAAPARTVQATQVDPSSDDAPAQDAPPRADLAEQAGRINELERQRAALQEALGDQSEKRRREKIEADLREIELRRVLGELCSAADVRRACEDAVTVFWQELTRRERDDADHIAAALALDEFRARKLRDLIRARMNRLREDYAAMLMKVSRELAGDGARPTRPAA